MKLIECHSVWSLWKLKRIIGILENILNVTFHDMNSNLAFISDQMVDYFIQVKSVVYGRSSLHFQVILEIVDSFTNKRLILRSFINSSKVWEYGPYLSFKQHSGNTGITPARAVQIEKGRIIFNYRSHLERSEKSYHLGRQMIEQYWLHTKQWTLTIHVSDIIW